MDSKNRFSLLERRSFKFCDPGGQDGKITAIKVINAPEGKERFVILETRIIMAHPTSMHCHYYESEQTMMTAFERGLIAYLVAIPTNPKNDQEFINYLLGDPVTTFVGYPGYIRSFYTDQEKGCPWFYATEDEEFDGDLLKPESYLP